jgi:hypothetical protein
LAFLSFVYLFYIKTLSFSTQAARLGTLELAFNLRFSDSLPVLLVPRKSRNYAKPQCVVYAGRARLAHELYFITFRQSAAHLDTLFHHYYTTIIAALNLQCKILISSTFFTK